MMKKLLIPLLSILPLVGMAQVTSVLFLGNSYTGTNNLPGTFYNLALAAGDSVYYDSNTPGGYTLQGHSTNSTSLAKINERDWDFVVLQEQSQRPSFPPAQVANDVYPYAESLVNTINTNSACTEPIFYMSWGRKDGDQVNCPNYPPLCTFEGMQNRLRTSYLEMGINNDARVAPCGAAWAALKLDSLTFHSGLYTGDGSHPSSWGQYLNACVFYATIFHKSPVGITWYSVVGQSDAEILQALAEEIVIDSLDTWNSRINLPQNDIDWAASGLDVNFINLSENAVNSSWDFDDGYSSSDDQPSHTFAGPGTYSVTYISDNGCGDSDTTHLDVIILTTDIKVLNKLDASISYISNGDYFINSNNHRIVNLKIMSSNGKLVHSISPDSNAFELSLTNQSKGIYTAILESSSGERKVIKLLR
jgi:hypothetical protein